MSTTNLTLFRKWSGWIGARTEPLWETCGRSTFHPVSTLLLASERYSPLNHTSSATTLGESLQPLKGFTTRSGRNLRKWGNRTVKRMYESMYVKVQKKYWPNLSLLGILGGAKETSGKVWENPSEFGNICWFHGGSVTTIQTFEKGRHYFSKIRL